jgi:rhamnose transport system permease protein
MMNVYRGLTYIFAKGAWVSAHQMNPEFKALALGRVLGINNLVWVALLIFIAAFYFLKYTRTGRKVYAVGSNMEAARISGINVDHILVMVYTIMGTISGLSGVLWVSKYASAQGDTASGYEMTVIAACVIGGVSISGGSGKVQGVFLGVVLLGILKQALPMLKVSPFWQDAIYGFIILFAVLLNTYFKRMADSNNLQRRKI